MLTSGPTSSSIVIVGEFPTDSDLKAGIPFASSGGAFLKESLAIVGITSFHALNVFSERPPYSDLDKWMVPKKGLPADYNLQQYARGKFLCPSKRPQLAEFHNHMASLKPNVIIALGGTALWALTGSSSIGQHRGAIALSQYGKVLPTYHPIAVQRQFSNRPVFLADLDKARRHSASPEYVRRSRQLLIQPTIQEVEDFEREHLSQASQIGCDVETERGQITCVSFAPTPDLGLVVPFVDREKPDYSYWDLASERRAWRMVRRVLGSHATKVFQNGAYDIQYFLRALCPVANAFEDTMILQHAAYPELPKGLGFLGSIHCDEPSWKLMRLKADTVKREE